MFIKPVHSKRYPRLPLKLKLLGPLMILIALNINCQEKSAAPVVNDSEVLSYLKYNLWSEDYAYDAGHFLMVPLHYAFKKEDKKLLEAFDQFFNRFLKDQSAFTSMDSELKRLQFNYLISRYLSLSCQSGQRPDKNLRALTDHLEKEFQYYYHEAKAINWKYPDNDNFEFKGNRNRILWKLTSDMDPSYFKKSIIDHELFLMGIAADLSSSYNACASLNPSPSILESLTEINTLAYIAFSSRFKKTESGWVFQPGFYSRHRDFKYAGCLTIACIEEGPSPIKDIAPDTSHSLRLPLVLTSLEEANSDDSVMQNFYKEAKSGLSSQLINKVIEVSKEGKEIRITNYLDGRNGYYRWDFETNQGDGYGPYEVGETFKLGWWTFLDDPKIKSIYAQISQNLKLKVPEELQYQDKTSRERNPIIANRFTNGLYTNITAMASAL